MKPYVRTLATSLITPFLVITLLMSCQRGVESPAHKERLTVIATLFPVYEFTRSIGGDKVRVTLLLPPGVEPHSFEPKPRDMLRVMAADLFVYSGRSMEPWVEGILKGVENRNLLVVDSSKGIDLMEQREATDKDSHERGHGKDGSPHMA